VVLDARHSFRGGFTAIEFLVLLGILIILAAIFVPYAMKVREENRRTVCRDHLRQIFQAMETYAANNSNFFPRAAPEDPAAPLAVFANDPETPNGVTKSLWLLVRGGYLVDGKVFLCPSGGTPAATDRQRYDFPGGESLGYSYASPFGLTEHYRLNDTLRPEFALMADSNPGGANAVARGAPLLDNERINSRNHRGAGQNVLYAYGAAEWQITPYSGMNNDNIYTVRGTRGATQPTSQPSTDAGVVDLTIRPGAPDDSFLLPVAPR
jgi:type II secretory pathway pseudopilin PulG